MMSMAIDQHAKNLVKNYGEAERTEALSYMKESFKVMELQQKYWEMAQAGNDPVTLATNVVLKNIGEDLGKRCFNFPAEFLAFVEQWVNEGNLGDDDQIADNFIRWKAQWLLHKTCD